MSMTTPPGRGHGLSLDDLASLLPGVPLRGTAPGGCILTGATLDSRAVRAGDLYAALPGANVHGASFGGAAVESGAVAVLTDEAGAGILTRDGVTGVPVLVVDSPRAVLGEVSAAVYGHPSQRIDVVGITGTNGKTTTAYIVDSAWAALGYTTGLIGTIETRIAGESVTSSHTTPESPALQALFAAMADRDVEHCVMEVSSHALALHRVDGTRFDVAVFTNLSREHLDFHGTMEAYFRAKAALFTRERSERGVVCVDDTWGRRLAAEARIPVITLATPAWSDAADDEAGGSDRAGLTPDWRLRPGEDGGFLLVRENTNSGPATIRVDSSLPGEHNQINTALAALVLLCSGVPAPDIERALAVRPRVPGRMEEIELTPGALAVDDPGAAPQVFVDFAHTPDAVTATLSALASLAATRGGRLVAVLGAGGNRDRGKRPLMGRAAARIADIVIVTDDNPRLEDPAEIRASVAAGARSVKRDVTVLDVPGREAGIETALREAGACAVVAILGKGHDTTQAIGTQMFDFDDRQVTVRSWARITGAEADAEVRP